MLSPSPIDLTWLKVCRDFAEIKGNADDDLIQHLITAFSRFALDRCGRDSLNQVAAYTETYDGSGGPRLFTRNSPIASVASLKVCGRLIPASAGFGKGGYYIEQTGRSLALRWPGSLSGAGFAIGANGDSFASGRGNIELVYTAGFPPRRQTNEAQTIGAAPFAANIVIVDCAGTWAADQGVMFADATPLVAVAQAPAPGDYVALGQGRYVFNAEDNGKAVLLSYDFNAPPADLELVATRAVAQALKRRGTLDQKSKSISAQGGTGTTSYRDWAMPPEDERVLLNYRRFTY